MPLTEPLPEDDDEESIKGRFQKAKAEAKALGGWAAFRSGDWLIRLVQQSFTSYIKNANIEYFQSKYKTTSKTFIANKFISIASRNAMLLGGITGAAISTDEIVMVATGAEVGIGLPANVAIGAASIMGELLLLTKFQLKLVANLAKLYEVPLDPDDPEDILVILAYAMGGAIAEMAGKTGMKIGGKIAGKVAEEIFRKELLAAMKRIFAKIGVKILQRTIIRYVVPGASIFIGAGWNYTSTRTIGRIAVNHFMIRRNDRFE